MLKSPLNFAAVQICFAISVIAFSCDRPWKCSDLDTRSRYTKRVQEFAMQLYDKFSFSNK